MNYIFDEDVRRGSVDVALGRTKREIERAIGVDGYLAYEEAFRLEAERAMDRGVGDVEELKVVILKRLEYEVKRRH